MIGKMYRANGRIHIPIQKHRNNRRIATGYYDGYYFSDVAQFPPHFIWFTGWTMVGYPQVPDEEAKEILKKALSELVSKFEEVL